MEKRRFLSRKSGMIALTALILAGCGGNAAIDRNTEQAVEATPTPEPTKEPEKKPEPTKEPAAVVTPEEEPPAEPDYFAVYASALKENLDMIRDGYDPEKDYYYSSTGVIERVMYEESETLLDSIGYAIEDISNDGIPELLIGENISTYPGEEACAYIYAVYSIPEDRIMTVMEGWARNAYRWLGDGKFLYNGSGGAMYSSFGQCSLLPGAKELAWDEYYFTYEKNGAIAYYTNKSGVSDPDNATELNISGEDFWKQEEKYHPQKRDFIPMRSLVEEIGKMDPALLLSEQERPILGSWEVRSYVNMALIGYRMFADGTWLAIENPSRLSEGRPIEDKPLSGNWQGAYGGLDFDGFELYPEDGSASVYVKVYSDEYGDKVMEINGTEYYNNGEHEYTEITGSWLFPRGDSIVFDGDGEWNYYDDGNNWVLGGHSVIESGPNGIYLRLHTQAGDTGLTIFGRGIYHSDATGTDVIDMDFDPMFKDFVGEAATLSRGL